MANFSFGPRYLFAAMVLSATGILHAQSAANAPANVHIKPASSTDIAKVQTMLQAALSTGILPSDWQEDPTTIGPTLWKALKPQVTESELKEMTPVTMFIDAKPTIKGEGQAARTPENHVLIWNLLLKTYPALKTATMRPAVAREILYFWGTIPFDIDEPFFALDAGPDIFIVNIPQYKGRPSLLWIDRVAPYEELRPKP